jgi:hypothetical protein
MNDLMSIDGQAGDAGVDRCQRHGGTQQGCSAEATDFCCTYSYGYRSSAARLVRAGTPTGPGQILSWDSDPRHLLS